MKKNIYFPDVFSANKHNNNDKLIMPYDSYGVDDAVKDLKTGRLACKKQCHSISVVRNYSETCRKLKIFIANQLDSKMQRKNDSKRILKQIH